MGTPKYWMEDWKSRWDELGRYGVRQWTWDVTGTHSARTDRWKYVIRFLDRIDIQGYVGVTQQPQGKG